MANLSTLLSVLRAEMYFSPLHPNFTQEQKDLLQGAEKDQTLGPLLKNRADISRKLNEALDKPDVRAALGNEYKELKRLIGRLKPTLGPGAETRWQGAADPTLVLTIQWLGIEQKGGETYGYASSPLSPWRSHLEIHKAQVLEAARLVPEERFREKRPTAMILFAGSALDTPLKELIEMGFDVVLVDLDRPSMERAKNNLPEALRKHVRIEVRDLSGGFAPSFVLEARRILSQPISPYHALANALNYLERAEVDVPDLTAGQQVDLLVSAMGSRIMASQPLERLLSEHLQMFLPGIPNNLMAPYLAVSGKLFEAHAQAIAEAIDEFKGVAYYSIDTLVQVGSMADALIYNAQGQPLENLASYFEKNSLVIPHTLMEWPWHGTTVDLETAPVRMVQGLTLLSRKMADEMSAPSDASENAGEFSDGGRLFESVARYLPEAYLKKSRAEVVSYIQRILASGQIPVENIDDQIALQIALVTVLGPLFEDASFIKTLDSRYQESLSLSQPLNQLNRERQLASVLLSAFLSAFPASEVQRLLSSPANIAMALMFAALSPQGIEKLTQVRYGKSYDELFQKTEEGARYEPARYERIREITHVPMSPLVDSFPGRDFAVLHYLASQGIIPNETSEPFRVLRVGAGLFPRPKDLDGKVAADYFFSPEALLLADWLPTNSEYEVVDFSSQVIAAFDPDHLMQAAVPKFLSFFGLAGESLLDNLSKGRRYQDYSLSVSLIPLANYDTIRLIEMEPEIGRRMKVRQMDVVTESYDESLGGKSADLVYVSMMEHLLDNLEGGYNDILLHLVKVLGKVRPGGHVVFIRYQSGGHAFLDRLSDEVLDAFGFDSVRTMPLGAAPLNAHVYKRRIEPTPFATVLFENVEQVQARVRAESKEKVSDTDSEATHLLSEAESLIASWKDNPANYTFANVQAARRLLAQAYDLFQAAGDADRVRHVEDLLKTHFSIQGGAPAEKQSAAGLEAFIPKDVLDQVILGKIQWCRMVLPMGEPVSVTIEYDRLLKTLSFSIIGSTQATGLSEETIYSLEEVLFALGRYVGAEKMEINVSSFNVDPSAIKDLERDGYSEPASDPFFTGDTRTKRWKISVERNQRDVFSLESAHALAVQSLNLTASDLGLSVGGTNNRGVYRIRLPGVDTPLMIKINDPYRAQKEGKFYAWMAAQHIGPKFFGVLPVNLDGKEFLGILLEDMGPNAIRIANFYSHDLGLSPQVMERIKWRWNTTSSHTWARIKSVIENSSIHPRNAELLIAEDGRVVLIDAGSFSDYTGVGVSASIRMDGLLRVEKKLIQLLGEASFAGSDSSNSVDITSESGSDRGGVTYPHATPINSDLQSDRPTNAAISGASAVYDNAVLAIAGESVSGNSSDSLFKIVGAESVTVYDPVGFNIIGAVETADAPLSHVESEGTSETTPNHQVSSTLFDLAASRPMVGSSTYSSFAMRVMK